jgi:hypothetical protein
MDAEQALVARGLFMRATERMKTILELDTNFPKVVGKVGPSRSIA